MNDEGASTYHDPSIIRTSLLHCHRTFNSSHKPASLHLVLWLSLTTCWSLVSAVLFWLMCDCWHLLNPLSQRTCASRTVVESASARSKSLSVTKLWMSEWSATPAFSALQQAYVSSGLKDVLGTCEDCLVWLRFAWLAWLGLVPVRTAWRDSRKFFLPDLDNHMTKCFKQLLQVYPKNIFVKALYLTIWQCQMIINVSEYNTFLQVCLSILTSWMAHKGRGCFTQNFTMPSWSTPGYLNGLALLTK